MPTIHPIHDAADPRVEAYRNIRERDLVGRRGLFVAEGVVVLEKLVDTDPDLIQSLLIADKRVAALEPLWSRIGGDVPLYAASSDVFDAVAGFPVHRGVLAIARRVEDVGADALVGAAMPAGTAGDVLLLCGIANHDNMGGIFRNAAAFGVRAILLDPDCCDPLYRKAIRVSVGAALMVPFARLRRGEDPLALLAGHGIGSVALSPSGGTPLADWQPGERTALLLGAEGPGLDPALMAQVPTVRITMAAGFDSLNVATTSGIVLHHLRRGRAEAPPGSAR